MPNTEYLLDFDALRLAYLTCPLGPAKEYLGGLLVVDGHSRPHHFAYVEAVRPSRLQTLLYAGTLEKAARVGTIARELLKTLEKPPDVLFVDDADLESVRQYVARPVAHLQSSEDNKKELAYYRWSVFGSVNDEARVRGITDAIAETMPLLEPFERIWSVLKEIEKGSDT